MSLYPVTKQMLWQMIENERKLGGPFSLQGAITSYLYDLITGAEISQRNYAKIWRWTRKKVRINWEQIENTATLIHSNSQGPTRGPLGAQKDVIPMQKESIGAHEGPTWGPHLQNTIDLSNKETSEVLQDLSVDASAREASSSPSFDLSFLSDRDLDYESDIRETLGKYRPTDARELLIHRWRRPQVPPMVTLADLLRIHGWEVFAAGVVISADTEKPRLPFLTSILQRLTTQRHEQRRQNIRPEAATADDPGGSGIPIYNLVPNAGEAVPRGVRTGRPGGHQPPRRNQGAYKRPGERSYHESLVAAGYTPEEIAALYPPDRSDIGPARLPDRGAHDDDAPLGVVVHLRNRGQQGAA